MTDLDLYEKLRAEAKVCALCNLCTTRNEVVVDRGNPDARLMFIGEAPGEKEDIEGEAFVGPAGEELDKMLAKVGIGREQYLIVNVLKCFPGDVEVTSTTIERGYRRWYEGPLVEVWTGRRKLPGTPNHPVLTTRGWVSLGELVEGDDLVCGEVRQGMGLRDPHVEHGPTRFDELLGALSVSGVCERVVGSHHDFHGDGIKSDVEVVTENGLLGYWEDAARTQDVAERLLKGTLEGMRTLEASRSRHGSLLSFPKRAFTNATGKIRRFGERLSAFDPRPRQTHSKSIGFCPNDHSAFEEPLSKPTLADAMLGCEWLKSFAGNVTLEKVVKVERLTFAGHVHTLQTSEGWYTANGVIVSNCRPPNNRFPGDGGSKFKPEETVAKCLPYLDRQIELVNPKVIVLIGRKSTEWTIYRGQEAPTMGAIAGRWVRSDRYMYAEFFAMYHPAYLLRLRRDEDSHRAGEVEAQTVQVLRWAADALSGNLPDAMPLFLRAPGKRAEQGNLF